MYNALYVKLEKNKKAYICLLIFTNRKAKPENHEFHHQQEGTGWKGNGREWHFPEDIFLYSFDFWKHVNVLHIQKIKLSKNWKAQKWKQKENHNTESKLKQIIQFYFK